MTGDLSPVSAGLAALDWAVHPADSPAYRTRLGVSAAQMGARLAECAVRRAAGQAAPPCVRPRPGDRRFDHEAWKRWPVDVLAQSFLLTSGGHNAGIVSPPGHPHRHHRVITHTEGQPYQDPDAWLAATVEQPGSWWPRWERWLAERSGERVAPPPLGIAGQGSLADAPGTYVHER